MCVCVSERESVHHPGCVFVRERERQCVGGWERVCEGARESNQGTM